MEARTPSTHLLDHSYVVANAVSTHLPLLPHYFPFFFCEKDCFCRCCTMYRTSSNIFFNLDNRITDISLINPSWSTLVIPMLYGHARQDWGRNCRNTFRNTSNALNVFDVHLVINTMEMVSLISKSMSNQILRSLWNASVICSWLITSKVWKSLLRTYLN